MATMTSTAASSALGALLSDAMTMKTALNPSADALRLVAKIVGNVMKSPTEAKFRRINLSGKAGAKLTAAPRSVTLLQSIGFVDSSDGHLELPETAIPSESFSTIASQLEEAVRNLPAKPAAVAPAPIQTDVPPANMSLKQKALLMEEEKRKAKAENDKRLRAEQLAAFNRDKYARQNDPNWSAQAAGVKGGKDIGTYRDKFGEDQGGG